MSCSCQSEHVLQSSKRGLMLTYRQSVKLTCKTVPQIVPAQQLWIHVLNAHSRLLGIRWLLPQQPAPCQMAEISTPLTPVFLRSSSEAAILHDAGSNAARLGRQV